MCRQDSRGQALGSLGPLRLVCAPDLATLVVSSVLSAVGRTAPRRIGHDHQRGDCPPEPEEKHRPETTMDSTALNAQQASVNPAQPTMVYCLDDGLGWSVSD